MRLYVCGRIVGGQASEWELLGIYTERSAAVARCRVADTDFVGEAEADVDLPEDKMAWPGAVYSTDGGEVNPKDAFGDDKLPLDLVPETAIALASLAHLDGALKYGKWNWRKSGVRASTYVAACRRHLMAWNNGEDVAPDGVPHLAHALACLNIIVDAQACGKLEDDRAPRIAVSEFMAATAAYVPVLRERHKDRTPKHYTIADDV